MGPAEKAFVSPAAVGLKRIVHSKITILSSFTLPFKRLWTVRFFYVFESSPPRLHFLFDQKYNKNTFLCNVLI